MEIVDVNRHYSDNEEKTKSSSEGAPANTHASSLVKKGYIALVGNPNCGKTALFNALTGSRQKVSNYAGVTVERKEGILKLWGEKDQSSVTLVDLPGTYSLNARTPDEEITRDVVLGRYAGEVPPEAVVAVADATNLERSLVLVLELKEAGIPTILALNMMDLAEARGLRLDLGQLSKLLGLEVVPTVAVKKQGTAALLENLQKYLKITQSEEIKKSIAKQVARFSIEANASTESIKSRFTQIGAILEKAVIQRVGPSHWTTKLDRLVLHPVSGFLILTVLLGVLFQAIFTWAGPPADLIEKGVALTGDWIRATLPVSALTDLLVDGVIAGVGSVLVFLPQILILFFFILLLEDSGYMARAAFLMDRIMGGVGLHGRAFIPLLSSFACAIPGIMATRTIESKRDRLTTILVAPLMTCSARLPVYTLLIAAFIPNRPVFGPFRLQGLVMLGLYMAGVVAALAYAYLLKRTTLKGARPPLLLELPTYKIPSLKNLGIGLMDRARIFIRRAGTVILTLSILIWVLSTYPKPPENAANLTETYPAIHYSYAGKIGRAIEPLIRPLGYDWRVGIALIPGFAAREVMVSALGTVYAVEAKGEEESTASLQELLVRDWSLPVALSLLVWYIFAPQCLSTLAVTRRETNSWRWPIFMLVSLTAMAYAAAFLTYQLSKMFLV